MCFFLGWSLKDSNLFLRVGFGGSSRNRFERILLVREMNFRGKVRVIGVV